MANAGGRCILVANEDDGGVLIILQNAFLMQVMSLNLVSLNSCYVFTIELFIFGNLILNVTLTEMGIDLLIKLLYLYRFYTNALFKVIHSYFWLGIPLFV